MFTLGVSANAGIVTAFGHKLRELRVSVPGITQPSCCVSGHPEVYERKLYGDKSEVFEVAIDLLAVNLVSLPPSLALIEDFL